MIRTHHSAGSFSIRHGVHRQPQFEHLEPRALLATISISDASPVLEGDMRLQFIDQFVSEGSGGLARPRQPAFGPDGNGDGIEDLYVASADTDEILRYDGDTGAFLDAFIPRGRGGLSSPADVEFGPDGDLYVVSWGVSGSGKVLKYEGHTGVFLEEVTRGLERPLGIVFDSVGSLYVADQYNGQILKIDSTGRSVFVPSGSGGLLYPREAVFGPDANGDGNVDLYVANAEGGFRGRVLRYDGMTGAFIDALATLENGSPDWLDFGADGYLYVAEHGFIQPDQHVISFLRVDPATGLTVDSFFVGVSNWAFSVSADNIIYNAGPPGSHDSIQRFGSRSLAMFSVNLSSPSSSSITIDFQTMDDSALAGQDYVGTSGTLTFAPGQTMRTILVQTIDDAYRENDETFSVVLSSASAGYTVTRPNGTALIWDTDTQIAPVPGDFNGNGPVEQGDLDLVLLQWGQDADSAAPTWIGPRPTGLIDQNELDAVLLNWGTGSTAAWSAPAQSPFLIEPARPTTPQNDRLGVTPTRFPLAAEARTGIRSLPSADEGVLRDRLFAESMKSLDAAASIKYG